MKNTLCSVLIVLSVIFSTFAQEVSKDKASENENIDKPEAYKIFNSKGKEVSYKKMVKTLSENDMIFFGELHNNTISHWLQIELTRDLFALKGEKMILGAEMFESDNQVILNEYFLGFISQSNFEKEMRMWPNYSTDYKPLIEFAKENSLRFAATNVPRRYASMVSREGLDKLKELPSHSQIFLAPLPIEVDMSVECYKKMLEMGEGNVKFPHAQMLKDATMAYFILNNWSKGDFFIHFNGSYHSDSKEGIIHYIRLKEKSLRIMNISTVEQNNVEKLDKDNFSKADFIICTPSRMTKTY
jgi:uncharacterized iron-regulated protein